MFLEKTEKEKAPFKVTLTSVEECEVVSAAFSEFIHKKALVANSAKGRLVTKLAAIEISRPGFYIPSTEYITSVLDRFHEDTTEVVASIPDTSHVPAFANKYIAKRTKLGWLACQLSQDISEAADQLLGEADKPEDADNPWPSLDQSEAFRIFRAQLDAFDGFI